MCRMTVCDSDNKTDKTDGRTIRRGTRGNYVRNPADGPDLFQRYAMLLMAIMKYLGIPEYRFPRSNHIYSYRQKIGLLVVRKRMCLSYNQFILDLPSYPNMLDAFGLREYIPDKTTLVRFANAVDHGDLEAIVRAFCLFVDDPCVIALDCTGFSNFLRSAHFVKRCEELGIHKEPRSFTKGSFAVDIKTHIIMSARFSADKRHDIRFVDEHVSDLKGMDIGCMLMDKGYDSETVHRKLRQSLGCDTIIPCRESRGNRGFSVHGMIRNQMLDGLKDKDGEMRALYNKRPQAETANFMVKTHEGSHILSRLEHTRVTEGLCMVVAHNCKVVADLGLVWEVSA